MKTIIIGAGISGLCCAKQLDAKGEAFVVLEASDRVGGRIATDEVDGFLLDRGFQVFLTSYEEAQRVLDYDKLELKPFEPGALTFHGGKFHRLSDPLRRPQHFIATAISGAAELSDKLKVNTLRNNVGEGSVSDIYSRPEQTTLERLKAAGFSDKVLDRFFKPFMGGVFLEPDLTTSSRMFDFVFRMFSQGDATLPATGMQAIPKQIADGLPAESIRLNCRVRSVEGQTVTLESGESLTAENIVLATDQPSASQLTETTSSNHCGVTCVYFSSDKAPINEAILVLNGEGQGPVNNVCFPNLVSPSYAPAGKTLVSATVLGAEHDDSLADRVKTQLREWFGDGVDGYQHLKTYSIPFALPSQNTLEPVEKSPLLRAGLYRCGDDMDTASINGAMAAGRRAAEAILSNA